MLYLQRCGTEIEDDTFGHVACHNTKATIYGTSETIDVSGGWHDAGDYGRYVVPGAKTVADLLYAYAASPSSYGDATGIPEMVKYLFSSSNVAEHPPRLAQATLAPTFIVLSK